jgi:arylsulfatase
VTWPAGIRARGAIRSQFAEVMDITPTVLDVLGVEAPSALAGVTQMAMQGRSIHATFDDPHASTRATQFFRLRGDRAIRHDGWRAIATHRPGTSFDQDRWELYDLARDFSEAIDVAARYPDRLRELQALWQSEAKKYGALPLVEPPRGARPESE